jgi:uncharacterized protein YaeQ
MTGVGHWRSARSLTARVNSAVWRAISVILSAKLKQGSSVALKPVIYKLNLNLSDLNRHYYQSFNLTIAQHPSESDNRLMARLMAFCFEAEDDLSFTKGISEVEEPDIWARSLDDQIKLWIELGEPAPERVKKASHQCKAVRVYSFNTKSDVWWSQSANKFKALQANYYQFDAAEIDQLSSHLVRTMKWFVTISEESASVNTDSGECDISRHTLHSIAAK